MLKEKNISPGEQYKGAHSFKDFEGFLYKTLQGIQDPAQERPVSPSLRWLIIEFFPGPFWRNNPPSLLIFVSFILISIFIVYIIILPHSSVFLSHPRDPQRQMVFAFKLICFDRILVPISWHLIGFMSCMWFWLSYGTTSFVLDRFHVVYLQGLLYQIDFMLWTF